MQKNQEQAGELFKEVQGAYEVLSDAQEKAWYDKNREAILRGGGMPGANADEVEEVNLWPFFRSSCYDGFEGPDGFYAVYEELFSELVEQEEEAGKGPPIPGFGDVDSSEEEVKRFYDWWGSFSSRRGFSWLGEWGPYALKEAPNRRVKRAMEKENKKAADKGRKAHNEQVRELVLFIRRRDPRWAKMVKRDKEEREAREEKHRQVLQKRREEKTAHDEEYEEASMAMLDSLDGFLRQEMGIDLEAEAEAEIAEAQQREELYCPACKKKFRSEKQWENHAKSRKHQERVLVLRQEVMLGEEFEAELAEAEAEATAQMENASDDGEGFSGSENSHAGEEASDASDASEEEEREDKQAEEVLDCESEGEEEAERKTVVVEEVCTEEEEEEVDWEAEAERQAAIEMARRHRKKNKKRKNVISQPMSFLDESVASALLDEDDRRERENDASTTAPSETKNSTGTVGDSADNTMPMSEALSTAEKEKDDDDDDWSTGGGRGKGKGKKKKGRRAPKKQREANKAAAAALASSSPSPADLQAQEERREREEAAKAAAEEIKALAAAGELICAVCAGAFGSRNKLFQHIKATGHAQPLASPPQQRKGKKKRNRKG